METRQNPQNTDIESRYQIREATCMQGDRVAITVKEEMAQIMNE